jgi:hypothetical protein
VANATALFILYKSLPKSLSCAELGLTINDLLLRERSRDLPESDLMINNLLLRERSGDLPEFVVMAFLTILVIGGLWIIQT